MKKQARARVSLLMLFCIAAVPLMALQAFSAGSGSLTLGSTGRIVTIQLPWLHTDGRYLKDANGSVVILKGADTPQGGDSQTFWAGSKQLGDDDLALMKSWGANIIRFTFNGPWLNQYSPSIQTWVNRAENRGLYISLDMHRWDGAVGTCPTNVTAWIATWVNIANTYKTRSNVLFELFNEPATWTFSEWQSNAQQAVNAIRSTGATNIIVVDGWNWAGELNSFVQNGFLNGSNLVYTVHLYKNAYGHTPPSDHDGLQNYWRGQGWFYPLENNVAPIIYGEFNIQHSYSGDSQYPTESVAQDERNWMNTSIQLAEEWGISYTAWAWVGYQSSGGWNHEYLLLGDFVTPAPSGEILRYHLQKT